MSNKMKFKRITDLFTVGDVCYLGDDENGNPVCVWVSKTSSLHEEEARMDGHAAHTNALLAMADPMHPEVQNVVMNMAEWNKDELVKAVSNQNYENDVTGALADIEADTEWTDKLEYLRRFASLMDDAKVDEEDPRRKQWNDYNLEYLNVVEDIIKKRQEENVDELNSLPREDLEEKYLKNYKDKLAVEHYMLESRVTKLYFASRECDATKKEDESWDHAGCDHSKLLMPSRADVRELPEDVLEKIVNTYDNLGVGYRNVANFPNPQNS